MSERLKATLTGERVLAGLDKGRSKAIAQAQERAAQKTMLVVIAANADRDAGWPSRGLAGRISRKLGGAISERHCKRILDALSSVSETSRQDGAHINGGAS